MPLQEFGLPIFPTVGGRPDLVRDTSGLQGFREFLVGRFGVGFATEQPLSALVSALRGWQWAPAAPDCPVGGLRYAGSGALPPRATVDPAAATTALLAPPVVAAALPDWRRPLWESRPLCAGLFDRLSAQDMDREFLMGVVRNGVLLVPDLGAVAPFAVFNYSSALEAAPQVSAVVAEEVAQGWVFRVADPSPFEHPLGAVPKGDGGIRVLFMIIRSLLGWGQRS